MGDGAKEVLKEICPNKASWEEKSPAAPVFTAKRSYSGGTAKIFFESSSDD